MAAEMKLPEHVTLFCCTKPYKVISIIIIFPYRHACSGFPAFIRSSAIIPVRGVDGICQVPKQMDCICFFQYKYLSYYNVQAFCITQ